METGAWTDWGLEHENPGPQCEVIVDDVAIAEFFNH